MKSLNNYITEARVSKMEADSTIYFPSLSSYFIYLFEIKGQISDGYWENARPNNHWKWIMNAKPIVDENHEAGYYGPKHPKTYDCSWVTRELSKALNGNNDDYDWLTRVLKYGRAGMVLDKSVINKLDNDSYPIRYILEALPDEPTTPEEFEASLEEYQVKYWEKAKGIINKSFLKKFYNTKYELRDLKVDIADTQDAINTQLGEAE